MLNAANLPQEVHNGLWAEAAHTASDLENALVLSRRDTPAYQLLKKRYFRLSPVCVLLAS
jgi:hypothetical protein